MKNSKLFIIPKPNPQAKVRLFCFPFAGGGINTFVSWQTKLTKEVELVLVQPPGRGSRLLEAPHDTMQGVVAELMQDAKFITELPYVFFGHSLGSRVAFELCCELKQSGFNLPSYFIASGSKAAHLKRVRASVHDLPKERFVEELRRLNGTPKEVLANPDLLDLFIPLLKADFKIAYEYQAKPIKMPFPFIALNGDRDIEITREHLNAWFELSDATGEIYELRGGHFFIHEDTERVVNIVRKVLGRCVSFSAEEVAI
ncbi:thioesterase II family protein [Shewanella sp.]|uniref:thioesterase II family protein n=1 Tax=Shewanella sp. TaxID=50422 RepID=UPI004053834D